MSENVTHLWGLTPDELRDIRSKKEPLARHDHDFDESHGPELWALADRLDAQKSERRDVHQQTRDQVTSTGTMPGYDL